MKQRGIYIADIYAHKLKILKLHGFFKMLPRYVHTTLSKTLVLYFY